MWTNINEVKAKLLKAMNETKLCGTIEEILEGRYSVVVCIKPEDSPYDFTKKAKDLAFRLGKRKVIVNIDNTKQIVEISIPTTDTIFTSMDDVKPNKLKIPIGLSHTISRTDKIKFKFNDVEYEVNANVPIIHDFEKNPHLIVAGITGSGKSRLLHGILYQLLKSNKDDINIIPIDFKGTELKLYEKFMPVDFKPVETLVDVKETINKLVEIMEIRYKEYFKSEYTSIEDYNKKNTTKLNRIFLVIDEYADMILSSKKLADHVNNGIIRLAQKARAAGIHIIISTQRPTVDVLNGHIKANIETKIALRVGTSVDSRVILDQDGAESLLPGEFIYKLGTCEYGISFFVNLDKVKKDLFDIKINDIPPLLQAFKAFEAEKEKKEEEEAKIWERRDCEEWANYPVTGRKGGTTWGTTVMLEIDKVKEITAYELIANIAKKWDKSFDYVQFPVRRTLLFLEMIGQIKNERSIGTTSVFVNDTYLMNWKIINLGWERFKNANDRNVGSSNILDEYFTEKISKNNFWTLEEERKIARMLKYVTLDQRLRMLERAIDSIREESKQ